MDLVQSDCIVNIQVTVFIQPGSNPDFEFRPEIKSLGGQSDIMETKFKHSATNFE